MDQMIDLFHLQFGNFRNFESVIIQQGYVQKLLKVFQIVHSNIGVGTLRLKKVVSLFPNTDRVRFDSRKMFEIFYAKAALNAIQLFNFCVIKIKQYYKKNLKNKKREVRTRGIEPPRDLTPTRPST